MSLSKELSRPQSPESPFYIGFYYRAAVADRLCSSIDRECTTEVAVMELEKQMREKVSR